MKKIEVVAAAILSENGEKLFIARRKKDVHQGGLWEFPGGKKELDESPLDALHRELHEELGIETLKTEPLIKLSHDYGDKLVELDVYKVTQFKGRAHGAEGQETRWIQLEDIHHYEFPEANTAIIEALIA